MRTSGDLGADFLNWLAAKAAEVVQEVSPGIDEQTAAMIGEEIALRTSKDCAKQNIYIAEGRIFNAHKTHQLIAAELGPLSAPEVAAKYGISPQHVYRVAKRVNAAERARRQSTLLLEN